MKTKHLLLAPVMLMLTAFAAIAQDATFGKHPVKNIPFGKKLPPPDLANHPDNFLPEMISPGKSALRPDMRTPNANTIKKNSEYFRELLLDRRKSQTSLFQNATANAKRETTAIAKREMENNSASNFHLVKDINTLSESDPHNYNEKLGIDFYPYRDSLSFAVLDNVIYFVADDGTHGNELWRSDGTAEGTFMLKDIEPGAAASNVYNIISLNGKIYFSAYYGGQLWVSDGTESGTLFLNVYYPTNFFSIGDTTYFVSDGIGTRSAIWNTDGTVAGTKQVIDIGGRAMGGEQISQPTVVNGLLFFTFLDYETFGWQVWRSDLTDTGTYHVGTTYTFYDATTGELTDYTPAQLTNYKNKLYFSANDGTGRKLWVSDGTDAGTKRAPGSRNVLIDVHNLETSFPIVNNVLCVAGSESIKGNGLYKYDASNTAGLVRIKDLAPIGNTAFIVPEEMQVANNTLYFKVTNSTGGVHDELWSSKGTKASTRLVYKLLPGETINNLYNAEDTLYFVKRDKIFGAELWKVLDNPFGKFPVLVSDVFKGNPGSFPTHLTAFRGKLAFSAADEKKGNELFITNGLLFGFGATLVKDINTTTTSTSLAGYNPYNYLGYPGMIALGNDVIFTAYERVHGKELYKSDGTAAGTELLNDVIPGDAGFDALLFLSKNNAVYFIAVSNNGYSIYKTEGTKNSLQKITPDYSSIITFAVDNNGLVFYEVYNGATSVYELWRSDGTTASTYLLSSTLYKNLSYLNVAGNTALFVAGDAVHGYELWKSDGSVAGTKMVKDINPGVSSGVPGGMFIYKNEAYFSAYDSTSSFPSFWKSDGTEAGTIKIKNIDPWWDRNVTLTGRFFCVSNNILYFSAVDHLKGVGTELWKTDGTPGGTEVIKDINPSDSGINRGPYLLTDVNGTLFFTANDGVNGNELWKSDGTKEGTQLVKDLTPGSGSTPIYRLVSFDKKLFFTAVVNGVQGLWYSDGTPEGTKAVTDPGISDVRMIDIYATGKNLFFPGYTAKYGLELYAGEAGINNAPTVVLTSPANDTSYVALADIPLTAEAKNFTGTIKKIQFFSGTNLLATQNFYPYTYTWHKVPAGEYYFTAKATDDKGVVTTSEVVHVTVLANKPPVVSITSPADKMSYVGPATIPLVAEASDADSKIKKVQFFSGTTLLATQNFYPYTYTWHNVPAGDYSFTAQAMDDKGIVTTSDVVHVTVEEPGNQFVNAAKANPNNGSNAKLFSTGSLSLKTSPNPVKNILNIYTSGFDQNKKSTISVVSVSGALIKGLQSNNLNKKITLDVSTLSAGVYFIKAINGDKVLYSQFVKL